MIMEEDEILMLCIEDFTLEEYEEVKELLANKFPDRIIELKLISEIW